MPREGYRSVTLRESEIGEDILDWMRAQPVPMRDLAPIVYDALDLWAVEQGIRPRPQREANKRRRR